MKLEELVLRFSYDVVPSNVYWRSSWLRVYFNNYSCESLFSDCVFRTVDILNEITLRWVIMWWPQTGHLKRVLSIPYFFRISQMKNVGQNYVLAKFSYQITNKIFSRLITAQYFPIEVNNCHFNKQKLSFLLRGVKISRFITLLKSLYPRTLK